MKRKRKAIAIISGICCIAISFTACSIEKSDNSSNATESSCATTVSNAESEESTIETVIEQQVDENAGGEQNSVGYDVIAGD